MQYIIFNAVLYLSTLIIDIWYNKGFKKTSLIWVIYLCTSLFAIPFYSVSIEPYNNITLLPFIYLYGCIVISVYPFYSADIKKITTKNSKFLNLLIGLIAVSAFTPFVENLLHINDVFNNQSSIADLYETKMDDNFDKNKVIDWYDPISKYLNSICLQLQEITPILFFYYLTRARINKYILLGLGLAILNPMLYSMAMAGRGMASIALIYIFFIYLLLNNAIPEKRKVKIRLVGLCITSAFILGFAIMSIVRKESQTNNYDMLSWISLYFGESMLNFNDKMWNAPVLMQGDYSFSFFKSMFGIDTVKGIMECRDYWGTKLGFSIGRFFTYVGDILGDWGKIGGFVFIITISAFVKKKFVIKDGTIDISRLIIAICWAKVLLAGFTTYNYGTKSSSQRIVEVILICIVLSNPLRKNIINHYKKSL